MFLMDRRILFVADTMPGSLEDGGYNGGGWIGALLRLAPRLTGCFALAGLYDIDGVRKETKGGAALYKLPRPRESALDKIRKYYLGKETDTGSLAKDLRWVMEDFKPELVYLFGLENRVSDVVLNVSGAPVAVHLQGLLGPISKAYFPTGMSEKTFLKQFAVREHVRRNGYVYGYREMCRRAVREGDLIRKASYFMGRTEFDRSVVLAAHPRARYFKVNELLRDVFYAHAGAAQYRDRSRLKIVSTLSDTVYKGLDLVLKTAALLHSRMEIEWQIIGLDADARLAGIFERELGVRAEQAGVRFLGVCDAEKVCRTLLDADVYVHPSYIDNSPNSVCEAQMLGVPVIATGVGGVGSLIEDGVNGLLVPPGDAQALADALRRLSEDLTLRERLGRSGAAASAARHDPDAVLSSLQNVLQCIFSS